MSDSKDEKVVRSGGFGAFAEQYRARWAAGHPKALNREPAATPPEPSAPAAPDAPSDPKEQR